MKNQSKNQAPTPNHGDADLYEILWRYSEDRALALKIQASDALEAMLRHYLQPEAFAVLARYHRDFGDACANADLTFLDSLNELGSIGGVAELQRTLRCIKKEDVTKRSLARLQSKKEAA